MPCLICCCKSARGSALNYLLREAILWLSRKHMNQCYSILPEKVVKSCVKGSNSCVDGAFLLSHEYEFDIRIFLNSVKVVLVPKEMGIGLSESSF